jgi:hypothetical protein
MQVSHVAHARPEIKKCGAPRKYEEELYTLPIIEQGLRAALVDRVEPEVAPVDRVELHPTPPSSVPDPDRSFEELCAAGALLPSRKPPSRRPAPVARASFYLWPLDFRSLHSARSARNQTGGGRGAGGGGLSSRAGREANRF